MGSIAYFENELPDSSSITSDSNIWWDNTSSTVGIGTVSPGIEFSVVKSINNYSMRISGDPVLFDMEAKDILVRDTGGSIVPLSDGLNPDLDKIKEDINTIKFEMATSTQVQHLKDAMLEMAKLLDVVRNYSGMIDFKLSSFKENLHNFEKELEQI